MAPVTAVTAIRAAPLDEPLSSKRGASGSAVTGTNGNHCLINKLHAA